MAHQIMPTMVMSSFVDRVPRKAMAYLVYSMFEVSPERALSYGIVSDVVPAAKLDATVDKLTAAMLKAPTHLDPQRQGIRPHRARHAGRGRGRIRPQPARHDQLGGRDQETAGMSDEAAMNVSASASSAASAWTARFITPLGGSALAWPRAAQTGSGCGGSAC